MKCRAIRSLGAVLIAACVVSFLPTSYANPAAIYLQQASDSTSACCGSNGWQSSKRALSQPAELYVGKPARNNQPLSPSTGGPAHKQADSQTDSSQAEAKRLSGSQDQTREAPPFDRPPVGSTAPSRSDLTVAPSRSSADAGTNPRQEARGGSQSASRRRTLERDRLANSDASAERTTDSGQDDRGRNERPALQRPGDPQGSGRQTKPGRETEPTNAAADASGDDVVRLESTLVNIPLLVSDRAGRYIPQMTKRDFLLFEDGVEQEIATFSNEKVAFNVVLLLDMSPSVHGSVEAIQDACIAFVDQMRPQDRVMVVSFDRRIRFLTDLTNDRGQLESAIRSTYTGSGTSVHDAVYETVGRKLRNIEGRKALILFSDGEDTTSSSASYGDAIDLVSESDVLVYGLRFPAERGGYLRIDPRYRWPDLPLLRLPIPLPSPAPRRPRSPDSTSTMGPSASGQRARGDDFMADVATAGGGPVYDAQNVGDFSRLANQIAEELRHIYMISYYPKNKLSNGGYRTVRVRAKGNESLAVRHRKGYNAGSAGRTNTLTKTVYEK